MNGDIGSAATNGGAAAAEAAATAAAAAASIAHPSGGGGGGAASHARQPHCRYFSATFQRARLSLRALVEISPEYPARAPRFLLQSRAPSTSGGGAGGAAALYDNTMKEIEVEANSHYDELVDHTTVTS